MTRPATTAPLLLCPLLLCNPLSAAAAISTRRPPKDKSSVRARSIVATPASAAAHMRASRR